LQSETAASVIKASSELVDGFVGFAMSLVEKLSFVNIRGKNVCLESGIDSLFEIINKIKSSFHHKLEFLQGVKEMVRESHSSKRFCPKNHRLF